MSLRTLWYFAASFILGFAYRPKDSPGCHPLWVQTAEDSPSQVLKIGTPKNGVREYILDLPQDWKSDRPMPLVLAFHGKKQKNSVFRQQAQLSDPDFNKEALVAYPHGIDLQWSGDPTSPPLAEVNDIEFANRLIDHIAQMYCIDMRRIYAVGFSNGGGLTQVLACDKALSSKLAAVAIVSGAFYFDHTLKDPLFSSCTPARSPLPVLDFHGTKDPVIHYDGKGTPDGQTYDIAGWCYSWAERNGCPVGEQPRPVKTDSSRVQALAWRCGSWSESVLHYQIQGFGHGWPSKKVQEDDFQRLGPAPIEATPIILSFFQKHTLPEESQAFKDEL